MRNEIDYIVDGLLSSWYAWRREYKMTRGYSGRDGTCRDYRAPGHWDWKNGAAEARAEVTARSITLCSSSTSRGRATRRALRSPAPPR